MDALYLSKGRAALRRDLPEPIPAPDEALIRVTLAGICATDLELVKGYGSGFEGILGHEFTGVVTATPPGEEAWAGRRVTGTINLGCGRCDVCLADGPEHCPERMVLGIHGRDGAFAQWLALPVANLHLVPDGVSDEEAVFTEPLAAALRIREQVRIRPSHQIAVIGPGRLGLLIAWVLALAGTEVAVLGRSPTSLALPARWGLPTALAEDLPGNSFDLVVEATGNAAGFGQALRLVRPRGTLVLKSTFAGRPDLDLTKVVVDEVTVVGSRCGPFAPALRLLAEGAIPVPDLIDGRYPLTEAEAALDHAARPGVRKIFLIP